MPLFQMIIINLEVNTDTQTEKHYNIHRTKLNILINRLILLNTSTRNVDFEEFERLHFYLCLIVQEIIRSIQTYLNLFLVFKEGEIFFANQ